MQNQADLFTAFTYYTGKNSFFIQIYALRVRKYHAHAPKMYEV